ncbi:hypothetical protein V501_06725 [Pseudogymnoascus sp. VKM F-4519 (FW-2642)]|nr:hypothetical protein V501_06725 [Pseudogymnoascus sp. VKM F-4519 (FW-2642)]
MGTSLKDEKSTAGALAIEDERLDAPPTIATESIDSKDIDRAFIYLAGQDQSHLDHNVDLKALRRKIDWRILPIMSACYGLQFLDKVLINYSGVMGIQEELHLVKNDFSNASSVFYISYLIAMVPNGYILQKVTVTKWLCILAILWGIATACTAATFNYHSLLVTRIFAGLFESPVSPCMMLISSQWYTSQEQASRYSFWFCGAGLAQISGAFISYGFQHVHGTTSISSWRIMYLSLGLLTSFVGVVGFIILPKSPMTAKFLTDSEKVALLNHIAVNQTGIENRHFKWSQLKELVLDIQIWLLVLMTISVTCSSGVISSYSSIVIANLGFSSPKAALLTAPSGLVTIISSLIAGFGVRYSSNRRWAWIAAFCIPGMIGGALMSFAPLSKPAAIIIGTHLVYAIIPTLMLTFQWAMSNCVGQTKRVLASAFVSGAFAIGSIIGPQTFQDRDKPEYKPAKIAILATQGGGAVFATLLFGYYYWANKKKDRVEAALGPRPATEEGRQEWGSKTDKENLSAMAATGKTVSLYTTLLAQKLNRPLPEEMTLELPQPSKEFLAQKDGSRGIFLIHDYYGCKVQLHPDDTVVKSGKKVHLDEKHALDLAAELKIPAPRAYEASTAPDGIHNIIIKDMKIAGVIDWEYGGWAPEYWEYVKFFEAQAKNKDWREYAKYIFPRTYYDQLALFQGVLRWGVP